MFPVAWVYYIYVSKLFRQPCCPVRGLDLVTLRADLVRTVLAQWLFSQTYLNEHHVYHQRLLNEQDGLSCTVSAVKNLYLVKDLLPKEIQQTKRKRIHGSSLFE